MSEEKKDAIVEQEAQADVKDRQGRNGIRRKMHDSKRQAITIPVSLSCCLYQRASDIDSHLQTISP